MFSSVISSHLRAYTRFLRFLFLIFSIVILINVSIQFITRYLVTRSLEGIDLISIFSPLGGALVGCLIGLPIILINTLPLLLTFSSRRIDILKSSITFNAITSTIVAITAVLLLLYLNNNYADLPIYIMGFVLSDMTWMGVLLLIWFVFTVSFVLANIVYCIGICFYRFGLIIGFSSIALTILLLLFFANSIFFYYVWGSQQLIVSFLLLLVSAISIFLSWLMLSKAEVKMPAPQLRQSVFLVLALVVIGVSIPYTFMSSDTSENTFYKQRGTFLIYDQGMHGEDFIIEDGESFYINWRSKVESGTIRFAIIDSENQVVFESVDSGVAIRKLDLAPGTWRYEIHFNDAKEGIFSLNAMVR